MILQPVGLSLPPQNRPIHTSEVQNPGQIELGQGQN
jgi:hypothetical protein